jgi:nucleolar pre-ribosomal-associated protein 1
MHGLPTSTYSERTQVYLLLGELRETARQHSLLSTSQPHLSNGDNKKKREKDPALPSFVTQLAIFLLSVITNPADKVYSKANRFLMRSPTWIPVTRLIPYWTDQILLQEPEYDEPFAWNAEVNRYLDLCVSGLRTPQDMELYRKGDLFERIGSLYLSPALAGSDSGLAMRKKILNVLYNAMGIKGGSDTLITRVGIRAWLTTVQTREEGDEDMAGIVQALKGRLDETCSPEYVLGWEKERLIFLGRKIKH